MAVPRYLRSGDAAELLLCLAFAFLGARLPYAWDPSARAGVPRQTTAAGDLLFDLTFDRAAGEETVSTAWLVVLGIVLPLLLQCGLSWAQLWIEGRQRDDEKEDEERGANHDDDRPAEDDIEEYAAAIGTTLLFTESAKRYVGHMRPNFYQLCQPEYGDADTVICNEEASGDTNVERYQSFPSGHASVAYTGLTLLSLFLGRFFGFPPHHQQTNGKLPRRKVRWRRLAYFASVLLVQSLAMWIATSRIADQVHHPADALAGAVLGAGCAVFVDGMW